MNIFDRKSQQIKPTKYGNFVVNNAQSIISDVDKIRSGIDILKTGMEGTIRIGMHPFYLAFVDNALKSMIKSQSNLAFEFIMYGHREAVINVLGKDIDFYLGMISNEYALQHTELRFKPFPISKMIYVVNANHPLTKKNRVLGADTLQYDWIALDNRSTVIYKKWLMEALSLQSYSDIEKSIKVFVPDYSVIKKLLVLSNYIALMPKALIQSELKSNILKEIKPEWKIPHIKIQGFIMHLETFSFPPYLDRFMTGLTKNM